MGRYISGIADNKRLGLVVDVGFFLGLTLLIAYVGRIFTAHVDEGMLLSSAMAVAGGKVIYKDFFEFWTPGSVYVVGWVFGAFGVSEIARWAIFVSLHVLMSLSLYVVLKKARFDWRVALLSVAFFELVCLTMLYVSHHWFGLIGLFLTAYLLLQSLETRSRWMILGSGVMAGITCLFMQFEGAIAVTVGLIVYCWLFRENRLKAAGLFLSGVGVIGVLVSGYFLSQGAWGQFMYSVIYFPLAQYRESNTGWLGILWVLPALCLGLTFIYLRLRRLINEQLYVIFILAVVTQLSLITITGPSRLLILSVWTFSLLWLCWSDIIKQFILRFRNGFQQMEVITATNGRLLSKLLVLCGLFLSSSLFLLGVVGVTSPLWGMQVFSGHDRISTEAGEVVVPQVISDRTKQSLVFLSEKSAAELFYAGPYSSYYYFLMRQSNPIGYTQLTEKYNTEAMLNQAVSQLEGKQVGYVLYLPNESIFETSGDGVLLNYLQNNYEQVQTMSEVSVIRLSQNYKLLGSGWKLKE